MAPLFLSPTEGLGTMWALPESISTFGGVCFLLSFI